MNPSKPDPEETGKLTKAERRMFDASIRRVRRAIGLLADAAVDLQAFGLTQQSRALEAASYEAAQAVSSAEALSHQDASQKEGGR